MHRVATSTTPPPKEQHCDDAANARSYKSISGDCAAQLLRVVNKGPKAEHNCDDQQRAEDYDQHIRWKSAFHEGLTPSNETELSHRSGERGCAAVEDTLIKIDIDAQRQRAVGWSGWLDRMRIMDVRRPERLCTIVRNQGRRDRRR